MKKLTGSELDKYISWIEHLRNASKEKIILVEHKQDKDELERLSMENVIYLTEPYYKIVEEIAASGKECVLLFGHNKNSSELCERIKAMLQENGVEVNTRFRKLLLSSELREVRGLLNYLAKHVVLDKQKPAPIWPEEK
jgi:5S rRNA maturation endonuclease (ribonuclease M5)